MSKEDIHDLSTPLLRQRRNLMIISVLMLFVDMAGATVNKIVFSGVTIKLKDPNMVILFMFGFLLYFLYRYYLYLTQETGRNFKGMFYDSLNSHSYQKIWKLKNRKIKNLDEYSGKFKFNQMTKVSFWKRDVETITEIEDAPDNVIGKQTWGTFRIDIRYFAPEGFYALLHVLFKRSYVTDYILPYLLALTAIWINYPAILKMLNNP